MEITKDTTDSEIIDFIEKNTSIKDYLYTVILRNGDTESMFVVSGDHIRFIEDSRIKKRMIRAAKYSNKCSNIYGFVNAGDIFSYDANTELFLEWLKHQNFSRCMDGSSAFEKLNKEYLKKIVKGLHERNLESVIELAEVSEESKQYND